MPIYFTPFYNFFLKKLQIKKKMPKHSDQECKVTSSSFIFLKEIFKNENKNKKKSVFLVKEERTIKIMKLQNQVRKIRPLLFFLLNLEIKVHELIKTVVI